MGLLMKKEDVFVVSWFSFLFRIFHVLIFLLLQYMVPRRMVCVLILKVFSFWMSGGCVGWLVFRGLFADWLLKVYTFMAGKGVTLNGGQSNEHMNTYDSVPKKSTGNLWCFVRSEPVLMHRGVSNEHILDIFWWNQSVRLLIIDVNEDVKNLICENDPHEHLCVQSSKVQLRCPLVKAWVISNLLMYRGVSNEHILVNQNVINPYYKCS